jgi:hypothetical protein
MSLKHACTKNAEVGNWSDSMQVHFIENDRSNVDVNDIKVSCTREFPDMAERKSLLEARETCGSTRIEHSGISETELGLYDHIPTTGPRKAGE